MKQIDACREAARRCGYSESDIKRFIEKIHAYGAAPDDINKELEPGQEESFIQEQMDVLKAVAANRNNPLFQASMQRLRKRLISRN